MKLLLFSTLYPNAQTPHSAVFVENRLRHLMRDTGCRAHVIAPVPWFPLRHPRFGKYADFAAVPRREVRHGIVVEHPRYPVIPKIGMTVAPFLLYRWARGTVRRLMAAGHRFDLIDAHYFYPDGVAAAMLAREFDLPLTITGRGTDLNLIPRYRLCRAQIRSAARQADGLITVCDALADDLAALGIPRGDVTVLRNGVDLAAFRPDPEGAAALRDRLGDTAKGDGPLLLSVGHLIPRKGHELAIEALCLLPAARLWIVGGGPEEGRLKALAARLGVADRVAFLGVLPHEALSAVYSAGDVLILGSKREGWPNVLLESMACGTPVVATPVNGSPEVVRRPEAGRVVAERRADLIAEAVADIRSAPPTRAAVRAYAEGFSWHETSQGQMTLFRRILERRQARLDQPDQGQYQQEPSQ